MKRGRKKKFRIKLNIKGDTARSLAAMVLILVGIISFISFLLPDYTINEKVQGVLRGFFGTPSIIVPFLLVILGLLFVDALKLRIKEPRIVFGLLLALFSLSGLFHLFVAREDARELAEEGLGGGLIGYKISNLMIRTISIYGSAIVLGILVFVSALIIFDVSLDTLIKWLSEQAARLNIAGLKTLLKKKASEDTDVSLTAYRLGEDEEVEVTDAASAQSRDDAAEDEELSFEVIPTMSEPQSEKLGDSTEDTMTILPSVPALPYADKVWETPPLDLLMDVSSDKGDAGDVETRAKIIKETLKSFGITVEVVDVKLGPSVTQYALSYPANQSRVKISKISGLQNDLAMALASPTGTVRIEAPIPGKSLIGIEVPNDSRATVSFKSLVSSDAMKGLKSKIGIVLGKDVSGRVHVYDVGKMPHLLIAGTTGSGKSVFIHSVLFSMLYRASPQEVKFILVDPKRVELIYYQNMPHLLTPVITDVERAASVFRWAVNEMQRRYELFERAKARNIDIYNEKSGFQALPYIIIVVDELAEIMVLDPAGVEKSIIRLAQLARATGIHLILSVQRPSTNVITGLIKANIPARIAFNVASQVDSRVIIDQPGAEKLLGKGDMLFIPPDVAKPVRLQGALVTDKEINSLVNYLKGSGVQPDYHEEIFQAGGGHSKAVSGWGEGVDELFGQAAEVVMAARKASASLLQRKLAIGYARAARILDELEEKRIIGPAVGSKPRDILVDSLPDQGRSHGGHEEFPTVDSIQPTQ